MRASPEGNIAVDDNVSRAPSCKFGYSGCEHVGWAAVTIGEEQDVGVTSRRDREGPEAIDAEGNTGPFRQGHRDDGPTDRQPRGFPCLVLQVGAKPPPGADVHTNPPVKTFKHSQSARGAKVAGRCRMASLHHPRAHEQWYVNANRLIVQQTSRASHQMRVRRGLSGRPSRGRRQVYGYPGVGHRVSLPRFACGAGSRCYYFYWLRRDK